MTWPAGCLDSQKIRLSFLLFDAHLKVFVLVIIVFFFLQIKAKLSYFIGIYSKLISKVFLGRCLFKRLHAASILPVMLFTKAVFELI